MRLAFILFLLIPTTVVAQNKIHGFYANGKAGVANWADDVSLALSFEGGLLQQRNIYAVSFLKTEEADSRAVTYGLDITYGRFARSKRFVFHYQAGLGAVWGEGETEEDEPFTTVGLPLKTGFKFVPANFFSVGIDLQANINAQQSLYMAMFTIGIWPQTQE